MGSAPPPYRRDDDRSVPVDEAKINELTSQRVAAKFQRTPAPDLHRRTHRVRTARAPLAHRPGMRGDLTLSLCVAFVAVRGLCHRGLDP